MSRHSFSPFYHLFPLPFSHFESNFRRFFRWHVTLFSPELQFLFAPSYTSPYFGHFFEGSHPIFSPHFSFRTARILFRFVLPFLSHLPHLHFPLISFPLLIHPILFTPPPLSFSFLPTFPSPSPITHERAHPRASRAYAYARTYAHVRRFSFIAFTASPTSINPLGTNVLGVKENEKKPSPNTQSSHNQDISTKHSISSAVNFI